ncbi:MAG: S8 family serine peptidase [Bacteroidota bacterium]|nr:S8 family serine peptidase [Bacteroidota bacterium]
MKIIKTIVVILFIFQSTCSFAQDVSFYIQIEDPEIIPEVTKDENSDVLKVKAKKADLNILYNKYKIKEFEKAFPTAITPSLKNVYRLKCNDEKLVKELKENYKDKIPRLSYVGEPMLTYEPNDYGLAARQSYLDLINVKPAWDIVLGLPKIDIAISDTNFDLNHEDLNMTLFSGSNSGSYYHGTFVAGLVGAVTDNNVGIASVGFDTHLVVTSNYSDDNEVLLLAQAGYRVINCSWETHCTFDSIRNDLYNEIRNDWNAIVVFGAGNADWRHCGNNNPAYPGAYSSNIAVTSVGHIFNVGTQGSPSNNWKDVHEEVIGDSLSAHKHHPTIDICAPGYNVTSTDFSGSGGLNSGNYGNGWGTSFAAPQVSATVGLILSINPCLSANEAVNILLNTTDNSIYSITENAPYIGRLGTGRLDVTAAVTAAAESATTYLQNQTLSGNQSIESNFAIHAIGNVTVSSDANINLTTRKEVVLNGPFVVTTGATFSTNVDVNNVISCN